MPSPSVRSSSAGEGNGVGSPATMAIVLPATIVVGDTLIICLAADGYDEPYVGTSGFTRLCWAYNTGQDVTLAVFWKKASGSEDGTTVSLEGVSLQYAYACYAFQDASDPQITPPTASAVAQGTDSTAEPPQCNPGTSKDYYWLAIAGCDRRAFDGYPSDMTLNRLAAGTSSILNASIATAGKQSTATDYTPTGTFSITANEEWLAYTIGIHPAAGGPTEVNLIGAVTAASTIVGAMGQTYTDPPVITGVGPFLEYYSNTDSQWVDISNYVRSWWIDWGASGVQEQIRARTATFILDNNARQFEPMYVSGANYPDIKVGTHINCGLTVTSTDTTTTFPLFYGVAQAWRPGYSAPPARDMVCRLEACDPNITIASDLTSLDLGAQRSDEAIYALLENRIWKGFAGSLTYNLEPGDSTLQAYNADKESILSIVNRIVDSEAGWFYWQPAYHSIVARFLNRNYLSQQTSIETVYYLDDYGENGQYTDIVLGSADDHIYTRALITRVGGTQQSYKHATLGSELGEHTYTASNLLLATDAEAADRAAHIVETRARAAYSLYCSTIRATLALGQERYAHGANVLGLTQPFAIFNITHTPKTGSDLIFDCRVIGGSIGQRSPGDLVEITGNMVDAIVIGQDFWILQDAAKGILGTTTVLGW